jgi:hypothetical protein
MNCKPSQDVTLSKANNASCVIRSKQERIEMFERLVSCFAAYKPASLGRKSPRLRGFAFGCSAFAQHDSAVDEIGLATPLRFVTK